MVAAQTELRRTNVAVSGSGKGRSLVRTGPRQPPSKLIEFVSFRAGPLYAWRDVRRGS